MFQPFKVGKALSDEVGLVYLELDSILSRPINPPRGCDWLKKSLPMGPGTQPPYGK